MGDSGLGGALRGCGLGLLAGATLVRCWRPWGIGAAGGVVAPHTPRHDRGARPRPRRQRRGSCSARSVAARRRAARRSRWAPRTGCCASTRRRASGRRPSSCSSRLLAPGGRRMARPARRAAGVLAFVHAGAARCGRRAGRASFTLDAVHASALRGLRLPVADRAAAARSALLADWLIGLVVAAPRHAARARGRGCGHRARRARQAAVDGAARRTAS